MSGKRRADNQVTRENLHEHERSDDDDEAPKGPTLASADVLAKRKILKPRSRLNRAAGAGSAASSAAPSSGFSFGASTTAAANDKPANPFGGFGQSNTSTTSKPSFNFGQSTTQKDEEPSKPNPFGFFAKPSSDEKPIEEKPKNVFSFINNNNNKGETSLTKSPSTQLTSTQKSTQQDPKPNKIKALNDNFYNKITQEKNQDPVSNFTPILRKYIDYYEKIENDPEYLPDADQDQPIQPQLENKDEQKSLPAPNKPTFTFGQSQNQSKPAAITFGNNAASTAPAPTSFNFTKEPTPMEESKDDTINSTKNDGDQEVINVSNDSDNDSDDSDDSIKVEGPKFTLAAPPTTNDSVFKLNKSETNDKSNSNSTGPSFTFSASSTKFDNPFKLPPPDKKEDKKEETKEETKPTPAPVSNFSWNPEKPIKFGSSNDTKDEKDKEAPSKPTFSFGNNSSATQPFKFSAPSSTEKQDESTNKPTFSFNTTPSTSSTESKDVSKPTFNFGGSTTSTTTTENKDASKPTFNFGGSTTSSTTKPSFNFGANSTSTPPSFNFNDSSKPAFSFGQGSSTFNFNIGGNKPSTTTSTTTNDDKDDDDKVSEEEPTTNFKPVVQLTEKIEDKTGEEDEDVTYTKRSKLSIYQPGNKENPYESKGLGELKVLKHKETSKSRILVRSDGANRVLLNAAISKDFKYDTIGNGNTVRIPIVTAEGKIETYIARVKTPEDGKNLLNALQDAQK
ncbi:E3 SUMO-protein ligase [Wickerhamomyces ciferrii]|uniref:E3 SUMO-protein ligase n=1 Tax=Wickerhamomyces ciferrii (strain ATCC 14091 / BCRC 22168 / CBS 111 / JCM 3599 / NBRC 0793 / NRRL Y-1031 F-60-10) TaxID=1206466 RepID=K0KL19_WICCF|nr:E3 SUMO-protein ligase [Wickerhamomyces ciferrii]CCH45930.1 E3 SUMO-protein ligase [Wickerhamomyces ciferrii]